MLSGHNNQTPSLESRITLPPVATLSGSNFNLLFVNVIGVLLFSALVLSVAQLTLPEILQLSTHLFLVVFHLLQGHLVLFELQVLLIQLVVPLKVVRSFLGLSKRQINGTATHTYAWDVGRCTQSSS